MVKFLVGEFLTIKFHPRSSAITNTEGILRDLKYTNRDLDINIHKQKLAQSLRAILFWCLYYPVLWIIIELSVFYHRWGTKSWYPQHDIMLGSKPCCPKSTCAQTTLPVNPEWLKLIFFQKQTKNVVVNLKCLKESCKENLYAWFCKISWEQTNKPLAFGVFRGFGERRPPTMHFCLDSKWIRSLRSSWSNCAESDFAPKWMGEDGRQWMWFHTVSLCWSFDAPRWSEDLNLNFSPF